MSDIDLPMPAPIAEAVVAAAPAVETTSGAAAKSTRQSVSLLPKQDDALERLSLETGSSRGELIRQAINLLAITKTAEQQGLVLALANKDNSVLTRIVSSI